MVQVIKNNLLPRYRLPTTDSQLLSTKTNVFFDTCNNILIYGDERSKKGYVVTFGIISRFVFLSFSFVKTFSDNRVHQKCDT